MGLRRDLPAKHKTGVRSLGWEDPLKKGIPTLSSILACKIQWIEEPGELQSMVPQRVRHEQLTYINRVGVYGLFIYMDFSLGKDPREQSRRIKKWEKSYTKIRKYPYL